MEKMILNEFSEADKEFLGNLVSGAVNSLQDSVSELQTLQNDVLKTCEYENECLFYMLILVCFLFGSVLYISFVQRGIK